MGVKVVATTFLGRVVERELTEEEIHSLYDGSLNFKDIMAELKDKVIVMEDTV